MGLLDDMKKQAEKLRDDVAHASGLDNPEVRDNLGKLKSSLAEAGKQLKEVGKAAAGSVNKDPEPSEEAAGETVAFAGTDEQMGSQSSEHVEEIAGEDPAPEPVEALSSAVDRTENESPALGSDGSPVTGSQGSEEELQPEDASGSERPDEKNGDEAPTSERSETPVIKESRSISGKMPLAVFGIGALAIIGILFMLIRSCSSGGAAVPSGPTKAVALQIECAENLIFSKYDIDVYVDGKKLGSVDHGKTRTFDVELTEGDHELVITEQGNEDVDGTQEFSVEGEDTLYFKVWCKSDRVDIEVITKEEIEKKSADEEAEKFRKIADQPGARASKVIKQLEKAKYKKAGYTLICNEGDKELPEDFNADEFDVKNGEVNAETKEISLSLESNVEIEPNFSEEMAKRAVTVAITNCYATDVFGADGEYDPSKFHSYSDLSGYYMSISDKGVWEAVSENSWKVTDIKFRNADQTLYFSATGTVTFDGTNYVVSPVQFAYSNEGTESFWGSGDQTVEDLSASETTPYLTVPGGLIETNRNSAELSQKQEAVTSEKNAEKEYMDWIDSQFGWWDGENAELIRQVKARMGDSDSFKHEETTYVAIRDEETLASVNSILDKSQTPHANMKDLYVTMVFSGKNVYGGRVKNTAIGIIRYDSGEVALADVLEGVL